LRLSRAKSPRDHLLPTKRKSCAGSGSALVTVLTDKLRRICEFTAARFGAKRRGAFPKSGTPGAQGFFEDDAVLRLGASAVLGRSPLQGFDGIEGNVTHEELRHGLPILSSRRAA
jgi:hypothetical protein